MVPPTTYYSGDQSKKNGVGGACGTCVRQGRCIQDLLGRCDGKIHLEDLGLEGKRQGNPITGLDRP